MQYATIPNNYAYPPRILAIYWNRQNWTRTAVPCNSGAVLSVQDVLDRYRSIAPVLYKHAHIISTYSYSTITLGENVLKEGAGGG
jgi:hypothetical protein